MINTGFLHVIDILGTFSFAVSGAFFAMEKRLDPFGVLILSFVTAIGGGTLRDMMIGNLPVGWLRDGTATLVIFSAAIGTMLFDQWLKKFNRTLFLFDAMGLGLFTIIGIEKAIELNFSVGVCIALGTITASFGGVIRDVLLNNVPLVFRKEIYALASIIGGLCYFVLRSSSLDNDVAKIICILLILLIRLLAVKYKLGLPAFYAKNNKGES
ncbi:MAG: trimeric intracellular cation channel family protein [Ferruginibacter sp.]|nr:trimeric intracellular cation channel family protein [Bacteroidota bacterium]MBX2919801.1 trimeric intracellular cation channel family protein [Ferruginibacter sp.]MCC7379185.1 trimeric intracellular cation channel family protein [Chitinophagaceae bacterium]